MSDTDSTHREIPTRVLIVGFLYHIFIRPWLILFRRVRGGLRAIYQP